MHSWAISDGQAFRRSALTQIVVETIKLSGEANIKGSMTYANGRTPKRVPSATSPPAHGR
eukprot:6176665-Pleurochrysis_carterae.AAC.2